MVGVLAVVARTGSTVVMVAHDIDETLLLSERIVMMINGPAATIGEVPSVPLARPRDRLALAEDADCRHARSAVIDFLYPRHQQAV